MSFQFSIATREVLEQVVREPRFRAITTIPLFAWIPIGLIVVNYALFLGASTAHLQGALHWVVMMPINAVCIYAAFTPLHDAVHRSVSCNRSLNDLLGTISCFLLLPGITTRIYRYLHLEHHRYSGDPEKDPDEPFVSATGVTLPLVLAAPDVLWSIWYLRHWSSRPSRERIEFALSMTFYVAWHVFWLSSIYAMAFFLVWMVPQRFGLALVIYFFARIQHPKDVLWEQTPFQCTVHIPVHPVVRYLLLAQSEHHIHHLLPSVPFYRYHQAWEASKHLFDQQNIPTRGLFHPVRQLVFPDDIVVWHDVTVSQVWDVALETRAFELHAREGHSLPKFDAGSHLDIQIDEGLVRQYSMCNSPLESHRYLLAVKCEANGRGGSQALYDGLREGMDVKVSAPRNNFPLSKGATAYTLIAGGIGITPILSMAHELLQRGSRFHLHICARSRSHVPFGDTLNQLPFFDRITLHLDDGEDAQRLHPAEDIGVWEAGNEAYICGPRPFMDWFESEVGAIGWPDDAVFSETFVPRSLDTEPNTTFEVVMSRSDKTLTVAPDEFLIDVLNANGAGIPCSCTQGICGSCLTQVNEGVPLHRDAIMSDRERDRNDKMCVCVGRARSERLELDI